MTNTPSTFGTSAVRADKKQPFDIRIAPMHGRGVPRTAGEWTALVKVASGELDISGADCNRLLQLGLVECGTGKPSLTRHGRLTLGLPE